MASSLHLWGTLLLLSLAVAPHLGHVCFLHPRQRGNLNISYPGSDDCYRRTPYCGNFPPGPPTASFTAGEYVKINLQQNLNHFWVQNPGFFEIFISVVANPTSDPKDWTLLDKFDDFAANEMVTQTNFSRRILIPNVTCGNRCVLQVQYVSHNSDEVDPSNNVDAVFYNCADIEVVLPSSLPSASSLPHPSLFDSFSRSSSPSDVSCCAPSQWKGSAVEISKLGVTSHTIYYDADNLRVRWDRVGSLEQPNDNRTLTTITFYNPGPPYYEYLIDFTHKTCSIYGGDRFYEWCYGTVDGQSRAMAYTGQYTVGSQLYNEWQNPSNGFTFTANANGCLPDSIHHEDSSLTFKEFASLDDPSVFDVPSFCTNAEKRHGCGGL